MALYVPLALLPGLRGMRSHRQCHDERRLPMIIIRKRDARHMEYIDDAWASDEDARRHCDDDVTAIPAHRASGQPFYERTFSTL